jgi:hypothetical protein
LDARIVLNGREERVEDIGFERMLSVMEEAEKGMTLSSV